MKGRDIHCDLENTPRLTNILQTDKEGKVGQYPVARQKQRQLPSRTELYD